MIVTRLVWIPMQGIKPPFSIVNAVRMDMEFSHLCGSCGNCGNSMYDCVCDIAGYQDDYMPTDAECAWGEINDINKYIANNDQIMLDIGDDWSDHQWEAYHMNKEHAQERIAYLRTVIGCNIPF